MAFLCGIIPNKSDWIQMINNARLFLVWLTRIFLIAVRLSRKLPPCIWKRPLLLTLLEQRVDICMHSVSGIISHNSKAFKCTSRHFQLATSLFLYVATLIAPGKKRNMCPNTYSIKKQPVVKDITGVEYFGFLRKCFNVLGSSVCKKDYMDRWRGKSGFRVLMSQW